MAETPARRKREARLFWGFLGASLFICLVVAVLALVSSDTSRVLKREIERLRAAGVLQDIESLAPKLAPGQPNAADRYEQAYNLRNTSQADLDLMYSSPQVQVAPGSLAPPDWFPTWTADRQAAARRILEANRDSLAAVTEASRTRSCAFAVDWKAGLNATFPHYAHMRELARLLSLQAKVLAGDGNGDQALGSCATMFRMTEHSQADPVVIGQLVGYAVQGIAVATLEEVLSTSNPSAKACRALFEQLGAIDYVTSSVRAVKGDLAMTLVTFEGVRNGSLPLDDLLSLSGLQGGGSAREKVLRAYQTYGGPLMDLDEMAYLRLREK